MKDSLSAAIKRDEPMTLSQAQAWLATGQKLTVVSSFRFMFVYYCRCHELATAAVERALTVSEIDHQWLTSKACGVASYLERHRPNMQFVSHLNDLIHLKASK